MILDLDSDSLPREERIRRKLENDFTPIDGKKERQLTFYIDKPFEISYKDMTRIGGQPWFTMNLTAYTPHSEEKQYIFQIKNIYSDMDDVENVLESVPKVFEKIKQEVNLNNPISVRPSEINVPCTKEVSENNRRSRSEPVPCYRTNPNKGVSWESGQGNCVGLPLPDPLNPTVTKWNQVFNIGETDQIRIENFNRELKKVKKAPHKNLDGYIIEIEDLPPITFEYFIGNVKQKKQIKKTEQLTGIKAKYKYYRGTCQIPY